MKKKLLFIVNPHSGTSDKQALMPLLEKSVDVEKFEFDITFTTHAGHASDLATMAARNGVDAVVAVGGDGTVNETARGLIGTQTALGIVPCGSGNGLARHLFLPLSVKKALDVINAFEVHELDYGLIDGHPFFCTCGMGFDAFVSQKFSESGKRGPVTYLEQILKEGLRYQPETYEITDASGTQRYKAFLVSCANASQYGNNAYIAPQASMSDGLLDVIVMEPFKLIDAPQISIEMFNKTLDKSSFIHAFRTKRLVVHRSTEGVIHYDGDPVWAGRDIVVEVVNKGIRVIVNGKANKRLRRPNALQTAASVFLNEVHAMRNDLQKQGRHVLAVSKSLQRKLSI